MAQEFDTPTQQNRKNGPVRRHLSTGKKVVWGIVAGTGALVLGAGIIEEVTGNTNLPPIVWVAPHSNAQATHKVETAVAGTSTNTPENARAQMNAATLQNVNDWLHNPNSPITHEIHQNGGANLLRPTLAILPGGKGAYDSSNTPVKMTGSFDTAKYIGMQGDAGILGTYDAVDVKGVHHILAVFAVESDAGKNGVILIDLGATDGTDNVETRINITTDLSGGVVPSASVAQLAPYLNKHVGDKVTIGLEMAKVVSYNALRNHSTAAFDNDHHDATLATANQWIAGAPDQQLPTTPVANFKNYAAVYTLDLSVPLS